MQDAPINELSALQRRLDATKLAQYEVQFPRLAKELKGFWAGAESEADDSAVREKAMYAILVLTDAQDVCKRALGVARARIKKGRVTRLVGQIGSVVGTSTVIGFLGFGKALAGLVTSSLTLLTAIAALIADFLFAAPGVGGKAGLQDVFQTLVNAQLSLGLARSELSSMLKHGAVADELARAVGAANSVSREVLLGAADLLVLAQDGNAASY